MKGGGKDSKIVSIFYRIVSKNRTKDSRYLSPDFIELTTLFDTLVGTSFDAQHIGKQRVCMQLDY